MSEPIADSKPYATFVFNHEGEQYVMRQDYQRLRAALSWVPVAERLPAQAGDYLVFLDDYQQSVMVMNGCRDGDDWYWSDDWDRAKYVTHWMPLTKPPEVKD